MHLDPCRYAQHRHRGANHIVDIPGGAVAAGKEDEVDAALHQRPGGPAGIRGGTAGGIGATGYFAGQVQRLYYLGAHGAAPGSDTHPLLQSGDSAQRPLHPVQGPVPLGGLQAGKALPQFGAIAALQTQAAPQAGQWVDDQPYMQDRAHDSCSCSRQPSPRRISREATEGLCIKTRLPHTSLRGG